MLLEHKVAIVTGGSRGIGRAIALACAREGADVVINYWSDNDASYGRRSAIDEVVREVQTHGRRAVAVEGNVALPQTGVDLVRHAVDAFGKVDVLVSNAGICPFHAFLDTMTVALPTVMRTASGRNLHADNQGLRPWHCESGPRIAARSPEERRGRR